MSKCKLLRAGLAGGDTSLEIEAGAGGSQMRQKYSRFVKQNWEKHEMARLAGVQLALIDLPETFALIAELQQAVFGIVALAATRADQMTAPGGAAAVVIFRRSEGGAATARDEEHAKMLLVRFDH